MKGYQDILPNRIRAMLTEGLNLTNSHLIMDSLVNSNNRQDKDNKITKTNGND